MRTLIAGDGAVPLFGNVAEGSLPSMSARQDFMKVIRTAIERDVLVVAVTQCHRGSVSLDSYEVCSGRSSELEYAGTAVRHSRHLR